MKHISINRAWDYSINSFEIFDPSNILELVILNIENPEFISRFSNLRSLYLRYYGHDIVSTATLEISV